MADAPLPRDTARLMTELYTAESVETLADFVAATRAEVGGRALAVDDLCHVDGPADHVARTADETYPFRCFYDGVALAYLLDEPVEIQTESPSGVTIELRAMPDGAVEATPSGAAMSLGIARDVTDRIAGSPTVDEVYGVLCPYVKAFPSREHYRRWAASVDGATVGFPLAAGVPIAAALTGERTI